MDFAKKSKSLREERAGLIEENRTLLDTAQKEGRDLTTEEAAEYDKRDSDIEEKSGSIRRIERQAELSKEETDRIIERAAKSGIGTDEQKDKEAEYSDIFKRFMVGGASILSADERKVLQTRAQAAGTGSAGGFLVPQEFSDRLMTALKSYGGMRGVATVMPTASGGEMDWPLNDPTGNSGSWLAENTQASETDEVFTNKTLSAYTATSDIIRVSEQLIQDDAFNTDQWIADRFVERIGRLTNTAYTVGDGSAKPTGFVADANVGLTTAADDAITADEILDLYHSLDPAYRNMASFMFNDATFKAVRKLKDSENNYLWQPGMAAGEQDSLFGKSFTINQDMASIGGGNKPMAFGDFSYYVIRDVRGFTLKRLTERYADYLQVGFISFMRTDGKLMAANSGAQNPIQVMRNTTT